MPFCNILFLTINEFHNYLNLRHDDLREMLDNSKDGPKLDAMRRIVAVRRTSIFSLIFKQNSSLFFKYKIVLRVLQ